MVTAGAIDRSSLFHALPRALLGGFVGTVIFTLMMKSLAPVMLGHAMDIARVLGTFTGLGTGAGMLIHFLFGTVGVGVGFAIVGPYLAGPTWLRGVIFMAGVWLFAGLVLMPILGVGLFFGGFKEAVAALIGHLVFGAALGLIARLPSNGIHKVS